MSIAKFWNWCLGFKFKCGIYHSENFPAVPLWNCRRVAEFKILGKIIGYYFSLRLKKILFSSFQMENSEANSNTASESIQSDQNIYHFNFWYQVIQLAEHKLNYASCCDYRSLFELLSRVLLNGTERIEIWMPWASWNAGIVSWNCAL